MHDMKITLLPLLKLSVIFTSPHLLRARDLVDAPIVRLVVIQEEETVSHLEKETYHLPGFQ